jgi:hypothetical protein
MPNGASLTRDSQFRPRRQRPNCRVRQPLFRGRDKNLCDTDILLAKACHPRIIAATLLGEAGCDAGAEGATAPETLRQKDHKGQTELWREAFSKRPPKG